MYNFTTISYEAILNTYIDKVIKPEDLFRGFELLAMKEVEKQSLPDEIFLKTDLSKLGYVINKIAKNKFDLLLEKYSDKLPEFIALANKVFHASVVSGNLFFIDGIKNESIVNNTYTQELSTFEGYVKNEGAAYMAYCFAQSLTFVDQMKLTYPQFHGSHLMEALGLCWLNFVDTKYKDTDILDLNLLAEAFETFDLASGISMWDYGYNCAVEVKSHQMSKAAKKRHFENYQLKADAIKFWTNNINKSISNEEAANILLKVVPLSHRKLKEYVSEAKKKLLPLAS